MALWRVEEAADYLGIRPKTLYEWVRLDKVPHRKIGFNVRFDPSELEAWVAGQSRGDGGRAAAGSRRDNLAPAAAGGAAPPGAEARAGAADGLRLLAADASRTLRTLERDVGASLSYPRRREIAELADRLERAAAAEVPASSGSDET